jgi:hypothetical protein
MSSDEYLTEVELYGVSPGVIAFIMIVISVVFPVALIPLGPNFFFPVMILHAFIYPLPNLPLTVLNILFAYWVVRYYQAKSSKDSVIVLGMLSLMLPTLIGLSITGLSITIYPVPIQFIVGLILLWKFDGPEVISPWSGIRLDLSWWKYGKPKKQSDWDPLLEDTEVSSEEEWLKE